MIIETEHQIINANNATVFEFLTDLNNYKVLFPQDKLENWKAEEGNCTCKVKGLSDIGLKKIGSTPNSVVNLESYGKSPIKFTLNIHLSEEPNNTTKAYLIFDGEINAFMKVMLEKPLTKLFNSIAYRLKTNFDEPK